MADSLQAFLPILILLAVVAVVLVRLPKVDLGHSRAFVRRRFWNWFPLGLTYAFLYMGRYNLTVSKNYLPEGSITNADFGTIFLVGTWTYGLSFIVNGPLTDKFGGRRTILISAAGTAVANLLMGLVVLVGYTSNLVLVFSLLYALNMYFQSFGAVSIVKVNAHWFHLRERGMIGGVFGILISLGLYFAFDWSRLIAENAPTHWLFFTPAILLVVFLVIDYFLVRDTPAAAGLTDFDPEDASSGDNGEPVPVVEVFRRMLTNPVILTIAAIEFCSGYLRNAIMHWYIIFAKQTDIMDDFVPSNWGLMLCCAGILGGVFAGVISDRVFGSRRGPVAAVLYGLMVLGGVVMVFTVTTPALGYVVVFMSLCIIGVHGMLSGTASMDFGGRRNAGVAVGIIDGFVYLGTGAQALVLGSFAAPPEARAGDPANWWAWPLAMLPVAVIGLILATRVWNARPTKHAGSTRPAAAPEPAVRTTPAA